MTPSDSVPERIPDVPPISVDLSAELDVLSFELADRIATGANGEVYRQSLSDGTAIAVKVPDSSGTITDGRIDRILDEAEDWAEFEANEYVVSLVDYGIDDGQPWIAMEYMDRGHLGDFLDRGGVQSLCHGLWIARCIASGIEEAHYRGTAHRDIKPQNVLFRTVENGWNVPKVGDWGTASTLRSSSETIGEYTPRYAAPEQHARQVETRNQKMVDVFQFGIVLFLLFTGKHPYGRTTKRAGDAEPPHPSEVRPGIPRALEEVIRRCLNPEPEDRYEDIRPVLHRLDEFWDALCG
ncbi:serine/threonine-protein kinase [Halomicrobium mukohataei]|uniref:Serine/threonine protein kinase n=2 Tax=Halomicrobium mukohataei TaxID=57705 RepID=C7P500_HALMD|nr:serine/threonine-protein kinase [Halomicrobium mukohataei]ACV49395.1 serine/threonine protein kinase [Halomicrobium mukohataei DSM 12286]QCD67222.1 serine/threonine protein kinase [Halomicrobium mukohataei]